MNPEEREYVRKIIDRLCSIVNGIATLKYYLEQGLPYLKSISQGPIPSQTWIDPTTKYLYQRVQYPNGGTKWYSPDGTEYLGSTTSFLPYTTSKNVSVSSQNINQTYISGDMESITFTIEGIVYGRLYNIAVIGLNADLTINSRVTANNTIVVEISNTTNANIVVNTSITVLVADV